MHVALPIGKGFVLMGTDSLESMGQKVIPGNNFSLSLDVPTKTGVEIIFKKLSEGGRVRMTLGDTFWGAYFGMVQDRFGTNWMVNHTYPR